jgi:hypothetical protein
VDWASTRPISSWTTATWVLGVPHGLAVLHGKTRRGGLVFDVADLVKNTAVVCHWIRELDHTELLWIVGEASRFNAQAAVPTNTTTRNPCRGDQRPRSFALTPAIPQFVLGTS